MIKFKKKLTALFISTVLLIVPMLSSIAYANNIDNDINVIESTEDNNLRLVEEIEYYDEDGILIIERLYTNVNMKLRAASGSGNFKKTRDEKYTGGTVTIYVSGDFSWNSNNSTVTVSNVKSGGTTISGVTFNNTKTTSGSNQGGIWPGKKYAYAQYSVTLMNPIGMDRNPTVYIDVNIDGVSN